MEIEEAIEHCQEVAQRCNECGKDHSQLAAWLMELKDLRRGANNYIGGVHFAVREILKYLYIGDSYTAFEKMTSDRDMCFFVAQEIRRHFNDDKEKLKCDVDYLKKRLQDAESLIAEWEKYGTYLAVHGFKTIPDAWNYETKPDTPAKSNEAHGFWKHRSDDWFDFVECSVCGFGQNKPSDKCEHCGATMSGVVE